MSCSIEVDRFHISIPSGWIRQLYVDIGNFKKVVKHPNISDIYTFLKSNGYIVEKVTSCVNDQKEDDKNKTTKPPTTSAFQFARHSFLIVYANDDLDLENAAIIDPKFRDQFEIARPTDTYRDILKNVPDVFIGSKKQLIDAVQYIIIASHRSFLEAGMHIPPWRSRKSVLSKWRCIMI